MQSIYNWEEDTIKFTDKNGLSYDLQLKSPITVIDGASASGKSLMINRILELQEYEDNDPLRLYNTSNIYIFNNKREDFKHLKLKGKLIIIDRADLVLKDLDIKYINADSDNRYLIFCRKPIGLSISPNHYGELVCQDKKSQIRISYTFNESRWN